MFESVQLAPPDAILGLSEAFQRDPNPDKVNLTVGVYQDDAGRCPKLGCVRAAERRLLEDEVTKTYLGIGGLPEFGRHVQRLIFGHPHEVPAQHRAATVQTPGGTAAVRVAAEFVRRNFPTAKVWCSKPTWANHPNIFQAAGLEVATYPYVDQQGTGLDATGLLETLNRVPAGDVVCLHACCHNPTGIDPDREVWQEIARSAERQGWLPLVDFAYQGFGDGLEEDARSIHQLLAAVPEMLIASSFSKNFGLYGERVGALTAVAGTAEAAAAALSQIKAVIRANYSNPPKHGGAIVVTVLDDDTLRAQWLAELAEMRNRIHTLRGEFADGLDSAGVGRDVDFIRKQRGMFSYSGLKPLEVDRLRSESSIYIVGSGRINIAGLNATNLPRVCEAIAQVTRNG